MLRPPYPRRAVPRDRLRCPGGRLALSEVQGCPCGFLIKARDGLRMGPILVNTKQKIAVLAAGLVVATTGFVTDQAAVADPPASVPATHGSARPAGAGNEKLQEAFSKTSRDEALGRTP